MKIASKKPAVTKGCMYVTDKQYEVFYSVPKSLGLISKEGAYWYTTDGMRFASSRDAMEYLVRLERLRCGETVEDLPKKNVRAGAAAEGPAAEKRKNRNQLYLNVMRYIKEQEEKNASIFVERPEVGKRS